VKKRFRGDRPNGQKKGDVRQIVTFVLKGGSRRITPIGKTKGSTRGEKYVFVEGNSREDT